MQTKMSVHRRLRLKEATESLHRSLDDTVSGGGFLDTLDGYRDYLLRTYVARSAVETALERSEVRKIYPAWPDRRIVDALCQDIDDMGVVRRIEPLTLDMALGRGGVLGALYVLEGSSMGARWIAREVAKIGASAEYGARHLGAQAANPRAFRMFIDFLESTSLDDREEAECMSAAVDTFSCFQRAYAA